MKKYISLEHSIRNALTEGGAGFGTKGGDKARGTSGAFYNSYSSKHGGHSSAMARVAAKDAGKENIKMQEDGYVPNMGNDEPTSKSYGATEGGGKKKTVKEWAPIVAGIGRLVGGALIDKAIDKLTGNDNKGSSAASGEPMPVVADKAPTTTAAKTSTGNQTPVKKSKKTVKEETGDADRIKDAKVGRPWTGSKLKVQAEIQRKIIDENKKLVAVVKKTKEEQDPVKGSMKTKDFGNLVINPPLNKPDVGSYSH